MALVPAEIVKSFLARFGSGPAPNVFRAPGRVNLIGEHTDYNMGFVLPMALDLACYVAIRPTSDGYLQIYSENLNEEYSTGIATLANAEPRGAWHDYVIGVARELVAAGYVVPSAQVLIRSDVPAGSGLSSSAALEIASALALLGSQSIKDLDLAQLGQRAESGFVGMPCGIMDQYASVFGREGSAIQIDCRSLGHDYVALPNDVRVIAVNSMVKHELGSSAYRDRVAECRDAVAALAKLDSSIKTLRDVPLDFFTRVQEDVPPLPRQRARHVITDTARVVEFAAASEKHDLSEMGRLFVLSHRSMQFDYEISCDEIDFLVDTAVRIPGVYGARMTGGGFGGCTVNLVAPSAVDRFESQLSEAYRAQYKLDPVFYHCQPAAGAGQLSVQAA